MPSSPAVRTMPRTAFTPSPCPATRGRPRLVAHRPLPSMMTATWRGTGCARTRRLRSSSGSVDNSATDTPAPAFAAISDDGT